MISDSDVRKIEKALTTSLTVSLTNVFVTKAEFNELKETVGDIRVDLGDLNEKFDTLAGAFGHMQNTLDGIAGKLLDSMIEHGAGAVHLARHDRHIAALAKHTGAKLPA